MSQLVTAEVASRVTGLATNTLLGGDKWKDYRYGRLFDLDRIKKRMEEERDILEVRWKQYLFLSKRRLVHAFGRELVDCGLYESPHSYRQSVNNDVVSMNNDTLRRWKLVTHCFWKFVKDRGMLEEAERQKLV